jgi:hypothetical protein
MRANVKCGRHLVPPARLMGAVVSCPVAGTGQLLLYYCGKGAMGVPPLGGPVGVGGGIVVAVGGTVVAVGPTLVDVAGVPVLLPAPTLIWTQMPAPNAWACSFCMRHVPL